jgi:hypothetical protein
MSLTPRRAHSPAAAAALPIIERLSATIEAENRDLELGRRVKYETYSLAKNQGLQSPRSSTRRRGSGRTAARCAG